MQRDLLVADPPVHAEVGQIFIDDPLPLPVSLSVSGFGKISQGLVIPKIFQSAVCVRSPADKLASLCR